MLSCAGRFREKSRRLTRDPRSGNFALAGVVSGSVLVPVSAKGGHGCERGARNDGFRVLDPGAERDPARRGGGIGPVRPFGVEASIHHEVREDAWPLAQPRANPRGDSPRSRRSARETGPSASETFVPTHAGAMVLGDGDHRRGGGRGLGDHADDDAFVRTRLLIDRSIDGRSRPPVTCPMSLPSVSSPSEESE